MCLIFSSLTFIKHNEKEIKKAKPFDTNLNKNLNPNPNPNSFANLNHYYNSNCSVISNPLPYHTSNHNPNNEVALILTMT